MRAKLFHMIGALAATLAMLPAGGAFPAAGPAETAAAAPETPLLFCVGLHIEPFGAEINPLVKDRAGVRAQPPGRKKRPDYNNPRFFERHLRDIELLARIVEEHGGVMTVQAQTPFTRLLVERGETLLADLQRRGHEIALHFHEYAHLGRGADSLPAETWAAVMGDEISWLKRAGGPNTPIRYWSGGNNYPGLLEAAAGAGLEVMSDHKNPHRQETFPELLSIHPWRPAAGPEPDDISGFARHDPEGQIIYLPDGIFAGADFGERIREGAESFFEYHTDGLLRSLEAVRDDRVNVFHITLHPGQFRGGPRDEPYAALRRWLEEVIDPLVREGKVRWATLSEMADLYTRWEAEKTRGAVSWKIVKQRL